VSNPESGTAAAPTTMRLRIVLPTDVLVDQRIVKLVAEAPNGSFGLLPRHIDFVSALVPGVLTYVGADGEERFLGIDQGTLVKCGDEVIVSAHNAIPGEDLEGLRKTVRSTFLELDERERSARSALARLEAGVVRRFIELQEEMR
jgi:F-type H+-transporting ATPase subunit epsilon